MTTRCILNGDGEGGIRTHGGVTPTPVFETGLFNRSSTSPVQEIVLYSAVTFEATSLELRGWGTVAGLLFSTNASRII
jgi:hypothetical protein